MSNHPGHSLVYIALLLLWSALVAYVASLFGGNTNSWFTLTYIISALALVFWGLWRRNTKNPNVPLQFHRNSDD